VEKKRITHSVTVNAYLQDFFDHAPVGYLITSKEDMILEANVAATLLLGETRESLVGGTFFQFISQDDRTSYVDQCKRLVKTGEPVQWELHLLRKDQSPLLTQVNAALLATPDGNEVRRIIVTDISERRQTELAYRENALRLHNLADNLYNAVVYQILATPEGGRHFRYISRSVERVNGVKVEAVLDNANLLYEQLLPEYRELVAQREKEALEQFKTMQVEVKCKLADGQIRWFEYTSTPRYLTDGTLVWDGVEVDVTDRKLLEEDLEKRVEDRTRDLRTANNALMLEIEKRERIQQALQESERMLVEAQHLSHVGSWVWNPHTSETCWSAELYAIAGISPQQEAPDFGDGTSLFTPESAQIFRETLDRVFRESGKCEISLDLVRPDESVRHVVLRCRADQTESESTVTLSGTLQDITEWKRAEEERRHLESQMQFAQRAESLGILAGGVAHDFNNILQIILGNANHLQRIISEISPARPFLNNIEKSVNRAAMLTRQMLAYAGRAQLTTKLVDLGEITEEIVHLVRASMPKKIEILIDVEKTLPLVLADPAQVQQVIMNLLINAAESLEPELGGRISVYVAAMYCNEEFLRQSRTIDKIPPDNYVCLQVTDTGCGMNEEMLSHIFDPFFTTKFTGRGLGMSAVIGIMRAHNGAVLTKSTPKKGTTIRALFPISRQSEAAPDAKVHPVNTSLDNGKTCVLFADDEPDMLDLGVLMLEHLGCRVLTATDGVEALKVFKEHAQDISCVLLDLNMPRMDGVQTLKMLRTIKQDVRIILASGYGEKEIKTLFSGYTVDAFIEKPFNMQTLSDTLYNQI
jgi:PAS domain S-box-containing protein